MLSDQFTSYFDSGITACSRDGSVRLWDCGEAKCLAVVSKSDCSVNSCALIEHQGIAAGTSGEDEQHSKRVFTTSPWLHVQAP